MWMNHWIKTKGGALPAWLGSACSFQHPHSLLSRLTWALESRVAGTSFPCLITYGSSAVYGETTYTYMYTDIVGYAYIDNRLGISISFMLTFWPSCLCNRWKKSDVVTNISQHTVAPTSLAKLYWTFSAAQFSTVDMAPAKNNWSTWLHRTETIFR